MHPLLEGKAYLGSHVAVRSEMLKVCIKYKMYWTQVISYQNISNIWLLQPTCCNGVQVIPIVLFPPSYHFAKEILQLLHFQFACLTLPLWTLHWHGHGNIYYNTLNVSAIPFNQVRSQIILWASVWAIYIQGSVWERSEPLRNVGYPHFSPKIQTLSVPNPAHFAKAEDQGASFTGRPKFSGGILNGYESHLMPIVHCTVVEENC